MHYDLARKLTDARAARSSSADIEAVLLAVRSTVTDFGAMTQRVESMISLARSAAARATTPTRSARRSTSSPGCCAATSSCWARASTRSRTTRTAASPARASASWPTRSAPRTRRRSRSRELPEALRTARDRRRAADRRQGQRALARCTGASGWTTSACAASRPDGELAGEARLLGLFTTKAYTEPASETPVLHRKLRRVLEAEDLIEGSHDYKAAVALFDTFPKDELFAAPVDDLRRAVVALLALEGTDRVRLLGRRARRRAQRLVHPRAPARPLPRRCSSSASASCSSAASRRSDVEAQHMLGEGGTRVRVHFLVHAPDGLPDDRERRARARGRPARAHVGRRAARRAGRALRRRPRAAAVLDLGAAPARALQGLHGAARPARWTSRCSSSWPRTGRSWSRCSRCAATPASRSTSAGRRSSWATRCRCSRTSGCA